MRKLFASLWRREFLWRLSRHAGRRITVKDLAPILCAWDASWVDTVNASPAPIDVALKSTLVSGAESCKFAFRDLSVPLHTAKALRPSP